MKTKKIMTLMFFLSTKLNVSSKNEIPTERDIFSNEAFSINENVKNEELLELIKMYFNKTSGTFELINPVDEFSLHFLYKIQEESGMGTITFFPKLNKFWVATVSK